MTQPSQINFRKYIRWFWTLVFSPFILLGLLLLLALGGCFGELPDPAQLENPISNIATEVISSDGKVIGKFYAENRTNTRFENLSSNLVNALVATEDARYYDHSGVDLKALVRAVVKAGKDGGGSTLTQQLAKMLFSDKPSGKLERLTQKIKEWIIATRLEKRYTKQEIMAMYLNKFDFLNQAVGIQSAAKIYFNTTPDSLNILQAAMLVGMAKNPALFNPLRRPDTTLHRRNVVMKQMVIYGYLAQEKYDSLKTLPLGLNYQPESHNEGLATYFREYLRDKFLKKWAEENKKPDGSAYDIYRDGLKIYVTIDSRMQKYAEQAVSEHMKSLQKKFVEKEKKRKTFPFVRKVDTDKNIDVSVQKAMNSAMKRSERWKKMKKAGFSESDIIASFNKPDTMRVFSWDGEIDTVMTPWDSIRYYKAFLQTGFCSIEPQTGFVKAWVGGINHEHFQYDHVKEGARQVGSTFKPFVYALAIQEGWSPCTRIPNVPVTIHFDDKEWTPRNSTPKKMDGQMMTVKKALALSVNYITAYIMKQFTPEAAVTVARRLGITAKMDPYPSICLGTPDITVFEMVGAYSAFANKGTYNEPIFVTRIEDRNGKVLSEFIPKKVEVMDEEKSYVMLEMMKGVTQFGTGVGLRGAPYNFTSAIAGKTGTTQHNADGWFMGITPDLVSGCWVGGDDPIIHFTNMAEGQGSTMALPIWGLYMKKVWADKSLKIAKGDFQKPSKKVSIDLNCPKESDDGDLPFDEPENEIN
ncbi:MAG: transglycosylase domain-containing protein [Bacteroidota bacterium]